MTAAGIHLGKGREGWAARCLARAALSGNSLAAAMLADLLSGTRPTAARWWRTARLPLADH